MDARIDRDLEWPNPAARLEECAAWRTGLAFSFNRPSRGPPSGAAIRQARELVPEALRDLLAAHGFQVRTRMYDFLSTPLAGLLPGARWLYRAARLADEVLVRAPLMARWGSNFEVVARRAYV